MKSKRRFSDFGEVIDFAIRREEEAARRYTEMALFVLMPGLKEMLQELRSDEENHRRILVEIKEGEGKVRPPGPVPDIRISDDLAEEAASPDMSIQDLLILAAKKEKRAADLYRELAGREANPKLRKTFEFLAGQEKTHKLKLEAAYEEHVLKED